MTSYEATGRTVEEALAAGLEHLGVVISDVTYKVVDEGSKGLFGFFGSKPARVRLELKEEDNSKNELLSSLSQNLGEPAKTPPRKPKQAAEKPQSQPKPEPKPEPQPLKPAPERKAAPAQDAPRPPRKPKPASEAKPAPEAKPASEAKPVQPPKPAELADPATQAGKAQAYLKDITRLMHVPVEVAVRTDEEGNVLVNLEGDTLGVLIGRRGETLDALQYLTSLHVNKGQEGYTRVTLDTENYRAKREEALIRLANRMAGRAQKTGRKVALEPMNPYERRILHSALQNHEAVTTHSEGEEPNRHVVITLKKQA